MQADPIKPTLKPPGTKLLRLKYEKVVSNLAFNFNLRRYSKAVAAPPPPPPVVTVVKVGWCRLTLWNPS